MKKYLFNTLIFSILVFISKSQCTIDCVWPGDANNNGIVNNIDFLFFGVAYETGGPARAAVDQGIDWNPKTASNWTNSFPSISVNHKHADANGDGWIDGADLFSVNNVYDSINNSFSGLMGNVIPGTDLFLVFDKPIIQPSDTITIKIHLGSPTNPINNLHGIAFSIDFDTTKIREDLTTIDFHGGWLGTPFVDLFTLTKYDINLDPVKADFAATRGPNGAVSGSGEIGEIVVITEDVIAGKMQEIYTAINFNFKNVLGVDSLGTDVSITCKQDSVGVSDGIEASIFDEKNTSIVNIYPNPTQSILNINCEDKILNAVVVDLSGKKLNTVFVNNQIDLSILENGVYFIEIETEKGKTMKRVLVQ